MIAPAETTTRPAAAAPVAASRPPGLPGLVLSDLRAKAAWCYGDDRPAALLKALLTDGTAAMVAYRLMQWSRRRRLTPLELAFNKLNSAFCGCVIGRGAEFGPGFVLIHASGVVINGGVRGGANVRLEHQVTVGAERRRSPVLGDGVFIGAGAKVIGPVTVGDGARIGANAVVLHDVPPHATAVGIPARVVRRRDPPGGERNGNGEGDAGAGPRRGRSLDGTL
jgi:serine O-acetyltransferase